MYFYAIRLTNDEYTLTRYANYSIEVYNIVKEESKNDWQNIEVEKIETSPELRKPAKS